MSTTPKLLVSMLVFVALGLASAVSASAESFTFETTPTGYYTPSLTVSDGALSLTITTEGNPNGFINVGSSFVALLGSRSVIGSNVNPIASNQFAPMRFTFSSTVGAITFAFGDNGGDDDTPVTIQAYNSSNVLLGTLTTTYPAGASAGGTLSGNFAGATYFIVDSGAALDNPHSIWWEVQSVTPDGGAAVPEPTTMVLLGTGLVGVAARMRRRRQSK